MKTPPCGGGVLGGDKTLDGNLPIHRKDNPAASEKQPGDAAPNWQRLGTVASEITADLRRQRAATHLHRLGPRPVLEALGEVAAGRDLDRVLDSYARLDPGTVRKLGGDRFPPPPLSAVRK